ncbi:hypothetical protein D9611_011737 [Ephemerocybe angulata]|uniref:F-box domain-containing protein n=1 Tax=Ephemerocybe angulata TaxID=980116 RepID=A0A8H5C5Z4_9AGAR|nr:hypothetical protein D9611_011737 [Tulosesus angulatus]
MESLSVLDEKVADMHNALIPRNQAPRDPFPDRPKRLMEYLSALNEKVVDMYNALNIPRNHVHINNLPVEIIRRIFWFLQPDSWTVDVTDDHTCPKLLTHVCKQWRTIAFDYGELWSWISLPLCENVIEADKRCHYSLEHLGSAPVNLKLVGRFNPEGDSDDDGGDWDGHRNDPAKLDSDLVECLALNFKVIISYFSGNGNAIKTLTLCHMPSPILSALPAGLFPDLETLAWVQCEHNEVLWNRLGITQGPVIAFKDCTYLRRLVSCTKMSGYPVGTGFRPELFEVELPWSQLTHISEVRSTLAYRNLSACTSLRWANIDCVGTTVRSDGSQSTSTTFLGGVGNLAVSTTQLDDGTPTGLKRHSKMELQFSNSLLQVDFPHLRSFWLSHRRHRSVLTSLGKNTKEWLMKNLHGVKFLGLRLTDITSGALTSILAAAPETTTLLIHMGARGPVNDPCAILTGLQHPDKLWRKALLPKLHTLIIDVRSEIDRCNPGLGDSEEGAALRKVLDDRARRRHRTVRRSTRLRRLVVYGDSLGDIEDEFLPVVQPFIDRSGLLLRPELERDGTTTRCHPERFC